MEGAFGFEALSREEGLERKAPRLTKLEANFFADLRTYLELLEVSHRKEQEKNPAGKRVQFLGDELRNATRKAEALWEARERKITGLALKNARLDPANTPVAENLTNEEKPFYESLVAAFRAQQKKVLPFAAPLESPATKNPVLHAPNVPTAPPPPLATPPASAPSPPVAAAARPGTDELQTVRALVDIPPFVGFAGETYRIKKGEVLTLPKRFAKILKDRGQIAIVA